VYAYKILINHTKYARAAIEAKVLPMQPEKEVQPGARGAGETDISMEEEGLVRTDDKTSTSWSTGLFSIRGRWAKTGYLGRSSLLATVLIIILVVNALFFLGDMKGSVLDYADDPVQPHPGKTHPHATGTIMSILPVSSPPPAPEQENTDELPPGRDYSKEAYITLLSPSDPHPWAEGKTDYYFEAVKVIMHRVLRNQTTRDPFNRPFIVLVTSLVPRKQIKILESHGAIVRTVSTIAPPPGTVDFERINPRYKDQFTKMHVWNMTEYNRLLFVDADMLPIRSFHDVFDTGTKMKGDEEWLFAAVYDSGNSRRDNGRNPPGPEDKGRPADKDLNAGMFLLKPSSTQASYIFDMFIHPPKKDFSVFMEQDLLRWAYRDAGPYPWIRLSHLYNTQWCRPYDLDTAYVLHDKLWGGGRGTGDELRRKWYEAWGEMVGWDASRFGEGVQQWEEEEGKIACDLKAALTAERRGRSNNF
jgi:hypothetical protein